MAIIPKPQALVFQEFRLVPAEITDPLRAHISGPNGLLHRYSDEDEKATINVGEYDPTVDACYPWPGREAGSKVDDSYTKVYIDDALLLYHSDLINDASSGRGTVTPVSGRTNWIKSSSLSYKANGTNYPRSALFGDRDVKIGDRVYVRGVEDPEGECIEHDLWTFVEGFAADPTSGSTGEAQEDVDNQEDTEASAVPTKVAGPDNCIVLTPDGDDYDGLASGNVCETYTVEVVKSSISGCNAARLRITSASGTDDASEVAVELGTPVDIGSRGLKATFTATSGACEDDAESAGVAADELVVGQKWEIAVCQAFERPCARSHGTYTGDVDQIYIITVTKGGLWADLPEISVETNRGLDRSGPTTVTNYDTQIPVGTNGVAISFVDCLNDEAGGAFSASVGDGVLAGLRKGDKYYITAVSPSNGPIKTLILRDDLPEELLDAEDLDLKLFIQKNILVTENRVSNPPDVNYEAEATQLCLKAGITTYDASWTKLGVQQPLPVVGGLSGASVVYIEYREWVATLCGEVNGISDVAELDAIPGPLDEDNPLKWGVYRALGNSKGTTVWYTGVCEPDSLDSWQDVLERVDGRDDMYNFVPLTFDREIQNLFQAHANAESTPEAGNWKAMFAALQAKTVVMKVGKSSQDAQILHPTSKDGGEVMATVKDDPQATGTQYTLVSVPARNSNFITYGVKAGDELRYNYQTTPFGETVFRTAVVDRVISETSLRLLESIGESINVAQKIEIWHPLTKEEIKDDLKQQAGAFSDRRVVAVWPDFVGSAGNTEAGYFLAAGLAGLVSSVVPHQGLTNVEVVGWDDYARSTTFFSATQLKSLQDGGVWIVTESRDGVPYTYHALTTDTLDLNRREEMIRRNVDSMSYLYLRRIRGYIGRTNATPSMLGVVRDSIEATSQFLQEVTVPELGGQLIAYEIVRIRIHPLLTDRFDIVLNLTVPAPLNNIELHLVV